MLNIDESNTETADKKRERVLTSSKEEKFKKKEVKAQPENQKQ